MSYPTLDDVPEDWVPLTTGEGENIDGETFIKPTSNGFRLLRYHADSENDDMAFFDVEARDLIAALAEYQHDKFRSRRMRQ